ncbi:MAG: DUF2341 domain-containing protein [Desulfobacterales bacterium]|nr:DUF2341 domain-containing protein [Desulfobacterales bacterium]
MAWLSGWLYRKSNPIGNATGAGSGYQIKLTVHYGSGSDSAGDVYLSGKCETDFSDLRFTDANGVIQLPYFLESKTDSDNAIFWIKVYDSLESSPAPIYVYYGNASAVSISDGIGTFGLGSYGLFDDFGTPVNPVMSPTVAWETGHFLRWGSIVKIDATYYMYYSLDTTAAGIGRATSSDLKAWTKYASNPVIAEATNKDSPALLKDLDGITPVTDGGNYWMLSCAKDGSGIEIRSDSAIDNNTWTSSGNIITPNGVIGSWYKDKVWTCAFTKEDGTFYIFFQGYNATTGLWKIGYATASSVAGPYTVNNTPLIIPSLSWEGTLTVDPVIRKYGSAYYLFYTGGTADADSQNSYATSTSIVGTYTKSGIFITPKGISYPEIIWTGSLYVIEGDNLTTSGQKDYFERADLDGLFLTLPYTVGSGGSPWGTTGGTPTVSGGILTINSNGEYVKSRFTFGQSTALRSLFKFATYASYLQVGYNATIGASTVNQTGFFGYVTPIVKSISSKASSYTETDNGALGTAYHIWDIERSFEATKNYYLMDGGSLASHSTNIVLTALPILIEDKTGVGEIDVDWILVRKYCDPEPTWGSWGAEEEAGPPPSGTSFVAWIN